MNVNYINVQTTDYYQEWVMHTRTRALKYVHTRTYALWHVPISGQLDSRSIGAVGQIDTGQLEGYPKKLIFQNLMCNFLMSCWSQKAILLRPWCTN